MKPGRAKPRALLLLLPPQSLKNACNSSALQKYTCLPPVTRPRILPCKLPCCLANNSKTITSCIFLPCSPGRPSGKRHLAFFCNASREQAIRPIPRHNPARLLNGSVPLHSGWAITPNGSPLLHPCMQTSMLLPENPSPGRNLLLSVPVLPIFCSTDI